MKVEINLDPKLVWQLTDDAEKSGMKLGEYVAFMLTLKTPAPRRLSDRQKKIIELHGEGFSDVEIAERLECVRGYVVQVRRRHDLPPNRKKK